MVAVVGMSVIMNPAGLVVHEVGGHNQNDRKRQEPILEIVPHLFGHQQNYASVEDEDGNFAVMMAAVAVPK